jgi:hypothetical protein
MTRSALPRAAARATRTTRTQARFQSSTTSSSSTASNASGASSHVAAGVAGGVASAAILYGLYSYTPSGRVSSQFNKGLSEANKKYKVAAQKLQESTPDADDTINAIKNFCYSYVTLVPGGRGYVDSAFQDVETIRQNHREEADQILNDGYKQFQDLSKSGLSMETASKAYEIIADLTKKIGSLAGDAMSDIVDNHPQLKEKFGGSFDQLKQMGEQYGPEAKKQVDETWSQVRDVLGGGLTAANLDKVRKLIQEKVEQVKKLGDEAWKKGLEQAKPLLDKNPKVKELVEKNADVLKEGNVKELFDKVKNAVESGDFGGFEDYVKKTADKAKSNGSQASESLGLSQYFDMIPDGSEILSKLQQMKEVAEKHSEEGEKLVKETMDEVKQVLEKKSQKAQEILDKAKKEAK